MEMMKREHFNRWYNLVPYFLSVVTFEIPFQVSCTFQNSLRTAINLNLSPFQVLCASVYLTISFWLTGNYQENWRFSYFMLLVSFRSPLNVCKELILIKIVNIFFSLFCAPSQLRVGASSRDRLCPLRLPSL